MPQLAGLLPREGESLPVDLLEPMIKVRFRLLAAPVGFDTIFILLDKNANLVGWGHHLHLDVEEAVFGQCSLPLDLLLNVVALSLLLAHVAQLKLVSDG